MLSHLKANNLDLIDIIEKGMNSLFVG